MDCCPRHMVALRVRRAQRAPELHLHRVASEAKPGPPPSCDQGLSSEAPAHQTVCPPWAGPPPPCFLKRTLPNYAMPCEPCLALAWRILLKIDPRGCYFFSTTIMPWPICLCTKNLPCAFSSIFGVHGLQNETQMTRH